MSASIKRQSELAMGIEYLVEITDGKDAAETGLEGMFGSIEFSTFYSVGCQSNQSPS
jgi:hypothetical protein